MALPFSPATNAWFEAAFPAPTPAQAEGWPAIVSGDHTLIHAPTGSGKTLAAFMAAIDRLFTTPGEGTRVLYVSPLKALAHDVERNLRAPLRGIRTTAERLGIDVPEIDVAIRTGDTPQSERQRMLRHPPDILITTPESLYLMLTSRHRETFSTIETVIVDEVHAVAATKRGAHLAVSLERLTELTGAEPQRIGLSATQRPLETIARFLGGGTPTDDGWDPRPVTIVDTTTGGPPDLALDIRVTVDDMTNPPGELDDTGAPQRSIWPSIYPELLAAVREERSTIVFANSRRLAERVCNELNRLAGDEVARAHHGSVSRAQRLEIEDALKRGELPAVVATSTLELGIDMGAVDRVLQVEAPISVASGLQRVGRAGHRVGETSRATVFPKHRGDLLVATVVADRMRHGEVEETRIPQNPLDVLAQHLVAAVAVEDRSADDLFDLARRAAPYATLGRGVFDATLDMLAGRYPSDLFAELRPRVNWDRLTGDVTARPGAHRLAVSNPGTIPDRGNFRVTLPDGARVGELDEEMVYESRQGDVFLLGTSAWKIAAITHDRVEVVPAPGEAAPRLPFWHGDTPGRPLPTGRAVGRFLRETVADPDPARLTAELGLDERAAANLVAYLTEQQEATRAVPSDRTIVVERFLDEIGDWRVVIHSPLGARVHAPWAMALTHGFRERFGHDVDVIWSDDGIAFRFVDTDRIPGVDELVPDPDTVEELLMAHLPDTALFAARFREAAARSLLLPKRRPGSRTPLWQQRRRSADLLEVAKQFESFPVVLEVFREILRDDFDLPALQEVLGDVAARRISVVEVDTPSPSPFARSLVFAFTAAFLYEGDAPLAERRANALTLDRQLLAELLGEGELRDLLDPGAIEAVELAAQRLTDERKATHPDGVADLLRDLGPLTAAGVAARSIGMDTDSVLAGLVAARRVIEVHVAGESRFAVAEDASRLRDALGIQPPAGVADVFLEPVEDPLGDVVRRHARTHGPFTAAEAATHLGLPVAVVAQTLHRIGTVEGAFRRDVAETEWCDPDVLRRIKRRTLAGLRAEIEPVDAHRLATFVPEWQRISRRPSARGVDELVATLQGAVLPATVLARDVLPVRTNRSIDDLDRLLVSGEVVWAGRGALGRRDGRVALYARDQLPLLWYPTGDEVPVGPTHGAIRGHLAERGASFFGDLYAAAGGGDPDDVAEALWDLVWAGEVTNDSLAPVWAFIRRGRQGTRARTLSSRFPAHTQGRWSLLEPPAEAAERRAAAWVDQLVERHGVVTRSVVAAEGIPGGFSGLYPVLTHLEESGRLRRGYFVEGLGGAQFAAPGAVDRLRGRAGDELVGLAATDPANPYGGSIPWPETGARLSRSAGAYVVVDGDGLVAYWEAGGRTLHTFRRPAGLGAVLSEIGRRHKRLEVTTIDDHPIGTDPLAGELADLGWRTSPRGLRRPA
jgi:ATP-dependent Lhr-like helicase